jgi:SAM-dependent methyltransferase
MPGLADERRGELRTVVRTARQNAEGAYADRLRAYGLRRDCAANHRHTSDCFLVPVDSLQLSTEQARTRRALEAIIDREAVGFAARDAWDRTRRAIGRYVQGAAFTLLNRLAALRAMEVRGLIQETVPRRSEYGGRSVREYRLAEEQPSVSPAQLAERALREAFTEASQEIGALFADDDPYALLLPDPRALRDLLALFGERITGTDWRADDVLGWVYQYYQDQAREAFRRGRGEGGQRRQADADELAAINCLYTPDWVVRALVDNSLGRLLLERQDQLQQAFAHGWAEHELREPAGDTVASFCRYLVPSTEIDAERVDKPLRELRVLDPACGSGHFLIYAFDVLWRAYRQEEPDVSAEDHATAILEHNLFGIDIDLRACQLAALGLYLKAKEYAPSFKPRSLNVVCADVRMASGERAAKLLKELGDDPGLRAVAERIIGDLRYTAEIGSLLCVRRAIERVLREREAAAAGTSSGGQLEFATMAQRTLNEILGAVRSFERDALERHDMGGRLFATDAERSLGLVALLSERYDVVLMNPPYNKRQELSDALRDYLSEFYERTKHNIYAAFAEQAVEHLHPGGFLGMLTPLAYLYLTKLRLLRTEILGEQAAPEVILEFGWDILDPAQIQTAGTVARLPLDGVIDRDRRRSFWDLTGLRGSATKEQAFARGLALLRGGREAPDQFLVAPTELERIPGSPWAFWAPARLRRLFGALPPLDAGTAKQRDLETVADVRQGLTTADDARFTRRWWEVDPESIAPDRRWVPFVKGETYARWYHDPTLVVLWEQDGQEIKEYVCERYPYLKGKWEWVAKNPSFYFREGLTWQRINANRRVRTRYLPAGCIFADNGPSIFLANSAREELFALLAVLNSSLTNLAMLALTPERDWQVGQVSQFPIASEALASARLANTARELHDLRLAWDTGRETSSRFVAPRVLQLVTPSHMEPRTGHPLARDFSWPTHVSWREIEAVPGSREQPLKELLALIADKRALLDKRIANLEAEVDAEVFRCYDLDSDADAVLAALQRRLGAPVDEDDDPGEEQSGDDQGADDDAADELRNLLSFYALEAIRSGEESIVPLAPRASGDLVERVRDRLAADWGEERSRVLEDELQELLGCSLRDWLTSEYFPFHVQLYARRPIIWLLWSARRGGRGARRRAPAFACFLDYRRLGADTFHSVRGRYLATALADARADLDAAEREATEARVAGRSAARDLRNAEEARERVAELERFDAAVAALLQPPGDEARADRGWQAQRVAEITAGGYAPVLDYGVAVNIAPLQGRNLLHPAVDRRA